MRVDVDAYHFAFEFWWRVVSAADLERLEREMCQQPVGIITRINSAST